MNKQQELALPPIQQTIHGYSEGHRLLASSVRLPKDAERLILLLSDLSGSTGGEEFDPYLTGYPVESAGYYALARTWPAQEMSRPGCVWTHTLLIRDELLAGLIRPELLMPLFRRPSNLSGYSEYQEEIPTPEGFQDGDADLSDTTQIAPSLAERLLRALYGSSDPRIVLAVPRYALADAPLLWIWRLQWQSLRRRFTFCGGSRGLRSLDGEPFVLQAALERDLRRLDRGPTPPSLVPWTAEEVFADEQWVREAAEACAGSAGKPLRVFIDRVGRGLPGDTRLFRPVVQAYMILARHSDLDVVDELIGFAAKEYPKADLGRDFKRAILGDNLGGLTDSELIRGLATTENYQAFDADALGIRAKAASLWSSEETAWRLLVQLLSGRRNPLGEEVVLGLATSMPPTFLRAATDAPFEVLRGIISRNPSLASSEHLWDSPATHSRAAQALAACKDALVSESHRVIGVALEAKADPVNPSLIDVFGPASVATVLEWLNQKPARQLPQGWQASLAGQSPEMLVWMHSHEVHPATADFILAILNFEMVLANPLLPLVLVRHLDSEDAVSISVAARVLQAAMSSTAVDLASVTLDVVYQAAAASRLPDAAWHGLSPMLPESYWWPGWDRCLRLRKGIAEKFRNEDWPASKLMGITRDDALFGAIVSELRSRRSGRRVLYAAAEAEGPSARRNLIMSG